MPPNTSMDTVYVISPYLGNRDYVICVTSIANCNVSRTGNGIVQIVVWNELESHDFNILNTETCVVESPKPIIVTSFLSHFKSSMFGDHSMLIVPRSNQYLDNSKTVVSFGFERYYISVMMKQSENCSIDKKCDMKMNVNVSPLTVISINEFYFMGICFSCFSGVLFIFFNYVFLQVFEKQCAMLFLKKGSRSQKS